MRENQSIQWSLGLKFVQWQINISHHETIRTTPFKVTFGQNPKIGLSSTIIPPAMIDTICTEEDLDEVLQQNQPGQADGVSKTFLDIYV